MMKKYLFLIMTAIAVIMIVLALPGKKSFQLTGEEILERIGRRTHIISPHKLKEMNAAEPGLLLVDLRSNVEFAKDHLPGALNLPAESLGTGDIHRFFKGKESTRVIYTAETYEAERYWILLTQIGIEKLYILETGPRLDSLIKHWDTETSRKIMKDEVPAFVFIPDPTVNF